MGTSGTGNRVCPGCGREISMDANVCPHCGKDFRMIGQPAQKKETYMPLIGGILILVAGAHEIYYGTMMVIGGEELLPITFGMSSIIVVCGAIVAVLGIVAILGGVFAIRRKNFTLAILGCILGLLGAYIIVPIIGLILIALSKDEFS
ncbi:MAG TPA: zinc ribbon domain-containing protein [Thermoplasmata archaeon]